MRRNERAGAAPLSPTRLGDTPTRRRHRFHLVRRDQQRFDHRRRVAGVRGGAVTPTTVRGSGYHRMLSLVGGVDTAVFHFRDLRVGILRMGPLVVGALLGGFRSGRCQRSFKISPLPLMENSPTPG